MRFAKKLVSLTSCFAVTMAACGGTVVFESDGGDGGSGGADAVTIAASTSASSTSASSTSPVTTVTTTSGGDGGDASAVVSVAVASSGAVAVSSGQGGGIPSDTPCGSVCADDPGCDQIPADPNPGTPCETCIQGEVDRGTKSECAVAGALGDCCQSVGACAEYVSCVLGGARDCEREFAEGAARAFACVYASCGDCGDPG